MGSRPFFGQSPAQDPHKRALLPTPLVKGHADALAQANESKVKLPPQAGIIHISETPETPWSSSQPLTSCCLRLQEQEEAVQLVVRGIRRSVRLEELENSSDYTGQHGPQRGEGFPGARSAGLVEVLVEGFQERSRLIMGELRRFMVDDHEVTIGVLERTSESLPVIEPKFSVDFPEAAVREGADELTLRCAPSSTPRWEGEVDVDRRCWTRIGTPFARLFTRASKARSGKGCTTSM